MAREYYEVTGIKLEQVLLRHGKRDREEKLVCSLVCFLHASVFIGTFACFCACLLVDLLAYLFVNFPVCLHVFLFICVLHVCLFVWWLISFILFQYIWNS